MNVLNMMELFRRPAVAETFVDVVMCIAPLWLAVMVGLLVGWSWRPQWATLICFGLRSRFRFAFAWSATTPPGFGARRLWFAITALTAFPLLRKLWSSFNDSKAKRDAEDERSSSCNNGAVVSDDFPDSSLPFDGMSGDPVVNDSDLEHLLHMLQVKDGCPPWQQIMDRSTSTMSYQAWRFEPESGPTAYCSRTVIEDVTPELMRDFFWDDDFRPKWDFMLVHFKTLEECLVTGTMITHWIRKFPFFCSDREYIIGRRIWESGRTYYCVTKGVSHPSVPRRNKPRRVDVYNSSWRIRAVESRKGDGQFTACEVTLFHNEDMGIPKEIAKIGVRQGMWGAVKKIEPGVRAYQIARKSDIALSRCAYMAAINTRLPVSNIETVEISSGKTNVITAKGHHCIPWKWVILGGAVVVACGLHRGLMSNAMMFGMARRFGRSKQSRN